MKGFLRTAWRNFVRISRGFSAAIRDEVLETLIIKKKSEGNFGKTFQGILFFFLKKFRYVFLKKYIYGVIFERVHRKFSTGIFVKFWRIPARLSNGFFPNNSKDDFLQMFLDKFLKLSFRFLKENYLKTSEEISCKIDEKMRNVISNR